MVPLHHSHYQRLQALATVENIYSKLKPWKVPGKGQKNTHILGVNSKQRGKNCTMSMDGTWHRRKYHASTLVSHPMIIP